jgi:hypothetical protein
LTHFPDLNSWLEKQQAPACRFLDEFLANPGNVFTNRKRGFYMQFLKLLAYSKAFVFLAATHHAGP